MRSTICGLSTLFVVAVVLAGCREPACELLREACGNCDATGNGVFAQVACETVAEAGDEEACDSHVEGRTFEAFGCVASDP